MEWQLFIDCSPPRHEKHRIKEVLNMTSPLFYYICIRNQCFIKSKNNQ